MVQQQMSDKVSHLNLEELSVLNEPLKRVEARIEKEDSKYWTYIHQADTGRRQNICYLCLSTALNGNMMLWHDPVGPLRFHLSYILHKLYKSVTHAIFAVKTAAELCICTAIHILWSLVMSGNTKELI